MFAVVQFPIGDFRRFSASQAASVLPSPSWPPDVYAVPRFVHRFGAAAVRRLGVDFAWTDEGAYVHAHRALRLFAQRPSQLAPELRPPKCAFRRLFFDGNAVARVEVGFSLPVALRNSGSGVIAVAPNAAFTQADVGASQDQHHYVDPIAFAKWVLSLDTLVPASAAKGSGKSPRRTKRLFEQGDSLADLYCVSTQARGNLPSKSFVASGAPVVVLDEPSLSSELMPPSLRTIALGGNYSTALGHGIIQLGGAAVELWVIGKTDASSVDRRALRLCLLRLHAEQQVLRLALDRIASNQLAYLPRTDTGDRLENYLNTATRVIAREEWASGSRSAVLDAFEAIHGSRARDRVELLRRRLDGMRAQVRKKVEKFYLSDVIAAAQEHTTVNNTFNMQNATISNSTMAGVINGAVSTVNNAPIDDALKDVLLELLQAVRVTADSPVVAPTEEGKKMVAHAEEIVKGISEKQEDRKWYQVSVEGLSDAAKAVGDVGKPVLEAVAKLVPLLAAIFR